MGSSPYIELVNTILDDAIASRSEGEHPPSDTVAYDSMPSVYAHDFVRIPY